MFRFDNVFVQSTGEVVFHAVSALGIADGFTYVRPEFDTSCKNNQSRINNSQVRNNFARNAGLVIKEGNRNRDRVFTSINITE